MARSGWSQAPDDDAAEMYLWSLGRLEEAGYSQYEISNVSVAGRTSRHNLKYWQDGDWLGFGCGAHSTRGSVRWKNVSSTADYVARVTAGVGPLAERREMSRDERLEDAMLTGLRLAAGVDVEALSERYGIDVRRRYRDSLQPFLETGLVVEQGPLVRLTRNGMLVANEILQVFV
jgi:oxygen-independent coproporphyrinogen-3 oxidase